MIYRKHKNAIWSLVIVIAVMGIAFYRSSHAYESITVAIAYVMEIDSDNRTITIGGMGNGNQKLRAKPQDLDRMELGKDYLFEYKNYKTKEPLMVGFK
jgi:hypothetical protein